MTWVIGASTVFGYAVGIADFQATIKLITGEKVYIDGVKKIHHVGDFVAAGFCGDIQNGYELIEDLKKSFGSAGEGRCWIPDFVAREWGKKAKEWYAGLPDERKLPTQVMLFSVYPKEDTLTGLARSYVTQLNSPDFKPQKINRGAAVISMGSGNNVRKYIESVENINSDWFPLTGMETQNFGGFGGAIAIALQNELIRQPVKGVSSSIQICYVKRGGVGFAYPEVRVDVGTSNERIVKAPPLADNWEQFKQLVAQKGIMLTDAEALTA